jgi:hypothetical protein
MKKYILIALSLFFSNIAYSQTVNNTNNTNINIQGANQNVTISQSGVGHNANMSLSGDSISVIANQSGTTSQSFNLSVTCGSNCPSSPYIITQY